MGQRFLSVSIAQCLMDTCLTKHMITWSNERLGGYRHTDQADDEIICYAVLVYSDWWCCRAGRQDIWLAVVAVKNKKDCVMATYNTSDLDSVSEMKN